jgi:SnoaL-like domain
VDAEQAGQYRRGQVGCPCGERGVACLAGLDSVLAEPAGQGLGRAQDRERAPLPRSAKERELAERFAAAFADDNIDGVVALLTDDAWFTMPPATLEYQGPAAIASFLTQSSQYRGNRHTLLIPTRANGQPAFGCYVPDEHAQVLHPHGIMVLTMEGDRISAITRFIDSGLLPHFGLPRTLPG